MAEQHAPLDIAVANYPVAIKPAFGGEMAVKIVAENACEPGSLEINVANSGTYTSSTVDGTILTDNPQELVAVMQNRTHGGASNIILTVTGFDQDDGVLVGTATFKPPGYANITEKIFPKNFAVDVVVAAGKKFKSVSGVEVSCTATAVGGKISLFGVPDRTDFVTVGCTTEKDFTTGARVPKSIACGMDGTAFTKFGRSEEKTLNLTSKVATFGDGLARFDEARCTIMLEVKKEDTLVTDRIYLLGAVISLKPTFPDGEGEATFAATGKFEDLALMPAM